MCGEMREFFLLKYNRKSKVQTTSCNKTALLGYMWPCGYTEIYHPKFQIVAGSAEVVQW